MCWHRVRGRGLAVAGWGVSLWDVDHQVIIPVQGIIPAARVAEHLPRDGAQDRGGRHLGGGQWGQGCPHPSPGTPAWESQRPSHRAVGGSHRHLQQGEETQGGLSGRHRTCRGLAVPLKAVLGDGEGGKGSFKG